MGIAQLVAHEVSEFILCHEGSNALLTNDLGEDLFHKPDDLPAAQPKASKH